VLLSLFGLAVWSATSTVQRRLLAHWHESERARDR